MGIHPVYTDAILKYRRRRRYGYERPKARHRDCRGTDDTDCAPLVPKLGQRQCTANEKQREEFCAHALIPQTASLEFSHFEEFYEQRKALMAQRIRNLLAAPELAG